VRAFFTDASEAICIARLAGAKVIVNDRIDVALALRADGVHLGQTDIPVTTARRLLGNDAIIGFSTHNIEQVKAALDLPSITRIRSDLPNAKQRNPDPVAVSRRSASSSH